VLIVTFNQSTVEEKLAMPLFEGHRADKGPQRLFIEMPDDAKGRVAWKWPDQQIVRHSVINVDLDYQAVFTNLGKVIGIIAPGREPLDEGAALSYGWLINRLSGDAYYDTEVYFIATRDIPNVEFGGPLDNLTDGPSGLIVSVRVYGDLAYRVIDPSLLLAKLIGTGTGVGDSLDAMITNWVKEQAMAGIRAVLPALVESHGVLAMGELQDATAQATITHANATLATYGLALTTFAQLNVNLPDADAAQLKQFAMTRAYTNIAGSFDAAVRGQASLEIASGVAAGHVGAQEGIVAGMLMGLPGQTLARPAASPTAAGSAHFCQQCGRLLSAGARFCSSCGAAVSAESPAPTSTTASTTASAPTTPAE
jgi:membrane protease subunit (stomatin/prohibitin family)